MLEQQTDGPLKGLRILDLTRILAGPTCTQLLGDLGADVIKVERPGDGDDTRKWGPPYVKDNNGEDTTESAYYLSSNRNKRSITIDISSTEGVALLNASSDTVMCWSTTSKWVVSKNTASAMKT